MRRTTELTQRPLLSRIMAHHTIMKIAELTNCALHITRLDSRMEITHTHDECHMRASEQFRIWVRVRINKRAAIKILAIPRFSVLTARRDGLQNTAENQTCKSSNSIGHCLGAIWLLNTLIKFKCTCRRRESAHTFQLTWIKTIWNTCQKVKPQSKIIPG